MICHDINFFTNNPEALKKFKKIKFFLKVEKSFLFLLHFTRKKYKTKLFSVLDVNSHKKLWRKLGCLKNVD